MDLKIRNVPEDQVLVIQRKARKFGVSREEYLRRVIQGSVAKFSKKSILV
jgi:hypothetical protein